MNGIQQKPIEEISFAFTLDDAKGESLRKTQYFELGCNRGLYRDGWMASSPSFVPWDPNRGEWDPDKAPWELYKLDRDFSQANDLAQQYPEKLRELQDLSSGSKRPSTTCSRLIGAQRSDSTRN